jgi:MFS family permease
MVLAAITFFFLGVMIAAFANNFTLLLIGRSLQGVGGGGIITLTEIIVTDLVPLRFRGQWVGIISGMWSVGSVTGPIIGGVFAQKTTWRWIFYINLPFIAAGYIMVPLFLKLNFLPSSMSSKLRRVDWLGSIIFIGSMTSFLIPLTWGGVVYSWSSWRTLVPLLIGAAGLAGFCLYEKYLAAEPVIRLAIFANRTANIAYFNTVIHGLVLWCLLYYQPLYFEAVQGYSPIVSGVALFPATFTVAPSAVAVGFLITKTGRYRWSIWLGWTLTTLGAGILHLLDVNTTIPQWVFIDLISGLGLGILFPSLQFQLQAASSNSHLAFAVAMFSFFRSFGQALGVAIGGVIFQNQMAKNLMEYPQFAATANELARDAASLVQIIRDTHDGPDKLALRSAYAESLKTVYIVLTCLSGFALVLSAAIKGYDLNRGLETEQFLKTGEKSLEEGAEKIGA